MIARLISTSGGLKLRRITGGMRGRRVLVVVDRRLYAPDDPTAWPASPDAGTLLQACGKGTVFTARREIEDCCNTACPDSRVTLLPHELLPERRGGFARGLEIRRRRFKRIPNRSRRRALVVVAAAAALCSLVVALTTGIVSRASERVEAVNELRVERNRVVRHAEALRMRQAELLAIVADEDRDQSLSAGHLVDGLVQVLTNDERFSRISLVGNRLTLVVATDDAGVAARIGRLPGVRPFSHTIHHRDGERTATIEAQLE